MQASPQLEMHETQAPGSKAHSILQLEARLSQLIGTSVKVKLTSNRRTFVSLKKPPGRPIQLRMHQRFQWGDESMLTALAQFISHPDAPDARRALHQNWDRLVQQTGPTFNSLPALGHAKGQVHDLDHCLDLVLNQYFDALKRPQIMWGRQPPNRKRRHIRLGSFDFERCLIHIHPTLDHKQVPEFVICQIIHHELLHHQLGHRWINGRRQVHTPEFKRREHAYPDHDAAETWIREHLPYLLGHKSWLKLN